MKQGLKKYERICSERTIESLFLTGESFFEYPFKVVYLVNGQTPIKAGAEIAVSVPKKRIRLATGRNRIKRLVREAYRTNKAVLAEQLVAENVKLSIFLVFVGAADVKYDLVRQKIILILARLQRAVTTSAPKT